MRAGAFSHPFPNVNPFKKENLNIDLGVAKAGADGSLYCSVAENATSALCSPKNLSCTCDSQENSAPNDKLQAAARSLTQSVPARDSPSRADTLIAKYGSSASATSLLDVFSGTRSLSGSCAKDVNTPHLPPLMESTSTSQVERNNLDETKKARAFLCLCNHDTGEQGTVKTIKFSTVTETSCAPPPTPLHQGVATTGGDNPHSGSSVLAVNAETAMAHDVVETASHASPPATQQTSTVVNSGRVRSLTALFGGNDGTSNGDIEGPAKFFWQNSDYSYVAGDSRQQAAAPFKDPCLSPACTKEGTQAHTTRHTTLPVDLFPHTSEQVSKNLLHSHPPLPMPGPGEPDADGELSVREASASMQTNVDLQPAGVPLPEGMLKEKVVSDTAQPLDLPLSRQDGNRSPHFPPPCQIQRLEPKRAMQEEDEPIKELVSPEVHPLLQRASLPEAAPRNGHVLPVSGDTLKALTDGHRAEQTVHTFNQDAPGGRVQLCSSIVKLTKGTPSESPKSESSNPQTTDMAHRQNLNGENYNESDICTSSGLLLTGRSISDLTKTHQREQRKSRFLYLRPCYPASRC